MVMISSRLFESGRMEQKQETLHSQDFIKNAKENQLQELVSSDFNKTNSTASFKFGSVELGENMEIVACEVDVNRG